MVLKLFFLLVKVHIYLSQIFVFDKNSLVYGGQQQLLGFSHVILFVVIPLQVIFRQTAHAVGISQLHRFIEVFHSAVGVVLGHVVIHKALFRQLLLFAFSESEKSHIFPPLKIYSKRAKRLLGRF